VAVAAPAEIAVVAAAATKVAAGAATAEIAVVAAAAATKVAAAAVAGIDPNLHTQ
jgi:hypothetical protein